MAKKAVGKSFLSSLYHARQLADRGVKPNDPAFEERFPFLWLLLTETEIDPKHRCDAGQLTIWNSQGDWSGRAASLGLKGSKTVLVHTFDELLPALERSLVDETIPWQFWIKRKASVRRKNGDGEPLADGDD